MSIVSSISYKLILIDKDLDPYRNNNVYLLKNPYLILVIKLFELYLERELFLYSLRGY